MGVLGRLQGLLLVVVGPAGLLVSLVLLVLVVLVVGVGLGVVLLVLGVWWVLNCRRGCCCHRGLVGCKRGLLGIRDESVLFVWRVVAVSSTLGLDLGLLGFMQQPAAL